MFSYRTKWQLTPDTYRVAIKAVAKSMGLDPSRYSSHSLRIAGASALAAAGKPDWFIKRWGSLPDCCGCAGRPFLLPKGPFS